jgi:WD40 repeat protein
MASKLRRVAIGLFVFSSIFVSSRLPAQGNRQADPSARSDGPIARLGTLEWRDLDTGKQLQAPDAHTDTVLSVVPLADGKHLLSRDQSRLLVWHCPTGKLVRRYPDDLPENQTLEQYVTTDANCILTNDVNTGVVRLRDMLSGRALLVLEANDCPAKQNFQAAAVSADRKTAALVTHNGQIRIYDLSTRTVRHTYKGHWAVWYMTLSDDGRYVEWANRMLVVQRHNGNDGPFILDTLTGDMKPLAPATRPMSQWRYNPSYEAQSLLSAKKLVDLDGQTIDLAWQKLVFGLFPSPDGRWLGIHYGNVPSEEKWEKKFGLLDLETKKPLVHVKLEPGILGFSPDSRLTLNATHDGIIDVWEIATGQKRLQLKGHLPGEIPALAYLRDGRTLASGGADSQVLFWDLTGRAPDGVWRTVRHMPEKLVALWDALAAPDAAQAHRAIWELVADPEGIPRFLAEKLRPASVADAKVVAGLIEDLNSDKFATRQRANGELAKLGESAVPAIREALKNPAALEQTRRLQLLLGNIERSGLNGERLRGVRAIEVLELIGNPGARAVLEKLATGQSAARLTREAKETLGRMK